MLDASGAATSPSARSPLISFSQIMSEPLPPVDWLVDGIVANGDRVVVYAEFGAMKTWTLLDLGLHLAAGRPWLDTFNVPHSKTVLYVDEEMNRRELVRRVRLLGQSFGDVGSIPLTALSHHGVRLNDHGAKRFLDELCRWGRIPQVLIIDALRRVLDGDESMASDVSAFWRALEVLRGKNGHTRRVPMNSVVRSRLFDLGTRRDRTDDPNEPVFKCRYTQADKFFPKAVQRAQAALRAASKDASRLDGYTWHGNRHTFASRLVMRGVDARTVQELGGWRTLSMVQRYSHLDPCHLHAAVERLVAEAPSELARN